MAEESPIAAVHLQLHLTDAPASAVLGSALGSAVLALQEPILERGLCVHLLGQVGSGKTTLIRGLLRGAGVEGAVKSPTYTLLEPYEVSRLNLYHFDFYRFKKPSEFSEGGFGEYFGPGAVCLIEWPEKAGAYVPPADLRLSLRVLDAGRSATLDANTEIGARCLDLLRTNLRTARAGG